MTDRLPALAKDHGTDAGACRARLDAWAGEAEVACRPRRGVFARHRRRAGRPLAGAGGAACLAKSGHATRPPSRQGTPVLTRDAPVGINVFDARVAALATCCR